MTTLANDVFDFGALHKGVHDRLVADLQNIARDAAILPKWIYTPLSKEVPPSIVEWLRRFNFHAQEGYSGLVLQGSPTALTQVDDYTAAMAGALVRNFIRARVYTLNQAIDATQTGEIGDPTCLLIPNMFLGKSLGGSLVDWRTNLLYDLLFERHLAGQQTVVYVHNMDALQAEYGVAMAEMLKHHYQTIQL